MSSVTTSYTINIVCLFVLDLKNEEGGEEMDIYYALYYKYIII